jgi:DNA polymerase (family X)
MTNYELALRFTRIADALEIQGENPFKLRAYRNASATIDDLEDSVAEIAARGKLADLPGFGQGIIGMTRDFLETGTTGLWEKVKEEVPPGVLEMARVPGIGPKTVKTLWDALKVTDVPGLEAAARAGKVRLLPGFGAAKEAKLIENIEKWYRLNERTPRYLALLTAERIAKALRSRPEVRRVEVAGELRRGSDLVEEARLLVLSESPSETASAVLALPGLTDQTDADAPRRDGARLLTLQAEAGHRVVVAVESASSHWGFFLLGETGPVPFYAAVVEATTNQKMDNSTEEAVLAAAGLPYIEPELRDWPDILDIARRGELPNLVTEADFKGQLHEHSTWSDGVATIRQMAEAAMARGYEYLAITDHSRSLVVANGLSRERHLAQLEEIAALNREFAGRFTLLAGLEADILQDGSLDCDEDILKRLDVVVGSVHIRYREDEAAMTKRICTALANPYLTLLGHPTGRLLGRREPYPVDMDAVIEAAATHGKALEINASAERMDLRDEYARRAKARGVKISVNADAHSPAGLGLLPWGLSMARRAGLTAPDVINTYPLSELRKVVGVGGWRG